MSPNDEASGENTYKGASMDAASWERALKTAIRNPYVVQEVTTTATEKFPVQLYGGLEMKDMQIDMFAHAYQGKVQSASTFLSTSAPSGFSSIQGLVPTFVLESK